MSQRRRYRRRKWGFAALVLLLIVVFGVGAGIWIGAYNSTHETKTCKVDSQNGKDRSTDKDGGSVYRIYTDCGVFSVADDPLFGKFNSADTHARHPEGATYQFEVVGFRNGFFSQFPNILEAKQVGHE